MVFVLFTFVVTSKIFAEDLDSDFGPQIPDFLQTTIGKNGTNYCAPAAVSNSLLWLASQGYPELVSPQMTQKDLVLELASKRYFDTDKFNGTPPRALLLGLEKYLKNHRITDFKLRYSGIGPHPKRFSISTDLPDPNLILSADLRTTAVWLNVGWIKRLSNGMYQRAGAHWVTVVGFGSRPKGESIIAIHNPAPQAGKAKSTDFIYLRPFSVKQLVDKKGQIIQQNSLGYLVSGLPSKRKDAVLLTGVATLGFIP